MQTICDRCGDGVKKVGRLSNVRFWGISQKICKLCKRKVKMRVR